MNTARYWKYVRISSAQLFAGSIVLPVLAPYFSELGFSDGWISIVFGLFPFVMFASSIFLGEIGDSIGRSYLIRLALIATACSYMLYFIGLAPTIITGRILDAISYSALLILLIAKIQDLLVDKSRGKYTGIYFSIKDGVRVLGPVIGGYLADQYIGLPFITAAVVLVLIIFSLRDASFHKKHHTKIHPLQDVQWFVSHKSLKPLVILGPVMNGMLPASTVFLPLLVVNDLGLSYVAAGAASSAYMAGHILQFFFGSLADKIGSPKIIIAGTAVMALCVAATPLIGLNYFALLALFFVYGAGAAAWNVSANKWLSTIGERENKEATVMGSYISIAKFGEGMSYLICALIVEVFGYSGVFFSLGVVGLLGVFAASKVFVVQHLVTNHK